MKVKVFLDQKKQNWSICYKLIQGFRVTCLFTGQYTTEEHGTITDVI